MKLPTTVIIAPAKLKDYLLVYRLEDDKAAWLALAGYTRENWQQLAYDLREQILPLDAVPARSSQFGQMYEIRGTLVGPSSVQLPIRSFWMTEFETGETKFVTLYPNREQEL